MEKTRRGCVLPVSFPWADLGEWPSLLKFLKDSNSDSVAPAKHMRINAEGTIVLSADENELIVTIGVEDTLVVRNGNVTLVARMDLVREIKQVYSALSSGPGHDDWL
jgi:mannose-1-phosphate guanylyltransferase